MRWMDRSGEYQRHLFVDRLEDLVERPMLKLKRAQEVEGTEKNRRKDA